MANAPFTWGSNGPLSLQPGGIQLQDGQFLRNNGAKNYIRYNDASTNKTTGWSLGTATLTSAFPSGTPTFGSGANANLSLTTTATNPLSNGYSYSYASSAATTAGDFLASDAFTVDASDQAKVLNISFNYQVASGTVDMSGTSSNSFGIAIYDVTASAWIMPAGVWNLVQSSGVGRATATFQTTSSSTQYRLVVFNATATSGAVTLKFDDFYVGPQIETRGPAMSDWQDYTPTTQGFGTISANNSIWRRNGSNLEIKVKFQAGTVTANEARVGFPTGLTSTSTLPSPHVVGVFTTAHLTGASMYILAEPSVTYVTFSLSSASFNSQAKLQGSQLIGSNVIVTLFASIPIAGWSSNTVMSHDTDTRVVAAIVTGDPASATSGNPIIVPTVGYDSHASYNATTGRYTCPVSGIYKMFGALQSASSATTLTIYKNAVSTALAGNLDSNGEATFCGAVNCVAGDIIDLRPGGTVDATNMTLNIERLSGPAVVAASETVSASYQDTSGQSVTANTTNYTYNTKLWDTHGMYSAGLFTVPISGKYLVTFAEYVSSGTNPDIRLYKNGSIAQAICRQSATGVVFSGTVTVAAKAGDTLSIRSTVNATRGNSGPDMQVSIIRIGN